MVPFYHFTAAYKKATLRKVHSRKRIVSFSEKLEFFFRHQAFLQEHIGLGLLIFSSREGILFLHHFSVRRLLRHVGTIHEGHNNRCYCWDHPVGPWTGSRLSSGNKRFCWFLKLGSIIRMKFPNNKGFWQCPCICGMANIFKVLSSISPSLLPKDLFTSWVLVQELGDIVDAVVDDDPVR